MLLFQSKVLHRGICFRLQFHKFDKAILDEVFEIHVYNHRSFSWYSISIALISNNENYLNISLRLHYVVCVNLWRDLQSTLNDRFFEKLLMAIIFTLRVLVRNLLSGSRRRNIFLYFVLLEMSDLAYDTNPNERFYAIYCLF